MELSHIYFRRIISENIPVSSFKTKNLQMSRNVRKRTFKNVRPAKIQIRLRIRAVWSESSLGAFWTDKGG